MLYATVNYPDEGSVSFRSAWEKTLLEACKRECGCTIREVVRMLRLIDGDANASFDNALEEAREEALACQALLDNDAMSTTELIGVIRTTLRWLRYWSVYADDKAMIANQLMEREQALIGLMSKALRRGRMEVFGELEKLRTDGE